MVRKPGVDHDGGAGHPRHRRRRPCRAASPVAIDNTYAAGVLFDAFAAGVDISIQALTKYRRRAQRPAAGIGRDPRRDDGQRIGADDRPARPGGLARRLLARAARAADPRRPPERDRRSDAASGARGWRATRGDRDAPPRLPRLPRPRISGSATGAARRACSRSSSATGRAAQVETFVEALRLFRIGYSWGGVNSLVMAYATSTGPTREPARCWCDSTSAWKIPPT